MIYKGFQEQRKLYFRASFSRKNPLVSLRTSIRGTKGQRYIAVWNKTCLIFHFHKYDNAAKVLCCNNTVLFHAGNEFALALVLMSLV